MTYQCVTLKVCEGCGTLWVRKQATAGVYCAPCTDILQHFPDPKTRLRPGRPKKQSGDEFAGEMLPGMAPAMQAATQATGGAL